MPPEVNGHSNLPARPGDVQRTPEQEFAARVHRTALKQLAAILSTEDGKKAAHAITMAMLSAMRTARNPRSFLEVTDASVADCVATSYETGLHPGGPNPVVYLVPQAPRKGATPELQWRITHRGLAILSARAGYGVMAVPVSKQDAIEVGFGEVFVHRADPAAWPSSLDDLLGCILVVRRISDGAVITRAWMPRQAIEQRRQMSRDGGTWREWPIEMAQKTVIKWGFARGYVPLDSIEMRSAMSADSRGEVIDTTAEVVSGATGAAALGGDPAPRMIEGNAEPVPDYAEENARLSERQRVENEPAAEEERRTQSARAADPLARFKKAVGDELRLDPSAVLDFAHAQEIDLAALTGADRQAFFNDIKPNGSRRNALDKFLGTTTNAGNQADDDGGM